MPEIKNLLFQPLTLHLADSNKSIHLASRGKVTLKDKELSQEIKRAQAKGWVSIKNLPTADSQQPTKKGRAKT